MSKHLIGEAYKVKYDPNKVLPLIETDEPIFLTALLQAKNKKNANQRVYPESVLVRENNKYQELIIQGNALGELDHPQNNIVEYKTASHRITKTWWDGDNLMGTVEILSGKHFPCANILRGALKHNIPIGFSSRGLGSEHRIDDSTFQIGEDYELICYDAVVQPSTFGAFGRLNEHSSKQVIQRHRKIDQINSIVREILL